jgi:hypothetical protein
VDPILTHLEHVLPSILSVATGLAIFPERLEFALGDAFEARAETIMPPNAFLQMSVDGRLDCVKQGIQLSEIALQSATFAIAADYLQEAIYYDSHYHGLNPYAHSLNVILKCALALEIVCGGSGEHGVDRVRDRCADLGVPKEVVEYQLAPIIYARNRLATGHSTTFVPTPEEAQVLRQFAKRSVGAVRQLLLHMATVSEPSRSFLYGRASRDPEKVKLLGKLAEHIRTPAWSDAQWEVFGVQYPAT